MLTYQDFLTATNKQIFVFRAIAEHKASTAYLTAVDADAYDRQLNTTINQYVKTMFTLTGTEVEDFTATNSKIASNFFHRLNTQRCTYLLGNGMTFANDKDGALKDKLGNKFDNWLLDLGYYALIHGVSFGFWNVDRLHVFPLTEFVPLWDEYDGSMKAGIRFWQIDFDKPLIAILYELDGYTRYTEDDGGIKEAEPKRPYKLIVAQNQVGDRAVIGEENYSALPIVPMWGSKLHQSTLVGMKSAIDSFDLIRSGFANDLTDCAEIYWLVENSSGMSDEDLARFRQRLKISHIAEADTGDGAKVTPYTQSIPYEARQAYLQDIRNGIYEDFGGLDVHQVSADSTNDHLEAAYQPLDENADDFEYQVNDFIQQLLHVAGFEPDVPVFKRNKISNTREQVDMVLAEANYLDDETLLNKLPNISPDEVAEILRKRDEEDARRFSGLEREEEPEEQGEEE